MKNKYANIDNLKVLIIYIFIGLFFYYPLFQIKPFGTHDALYYQYNILDSIAQIKEGIFPQYVAQSQYLAEGNNYSAAPLYTFIGQFFYIIGVNNSILIQHLTVIFNIVMAIIFVYFIVLNLTYGDRLLAGGLSLAYVLSPTIPALIFGWSMYASFMSIPFIPLAFFSLYKLSLTFEVRWGVLGGLALAFVWLGHPPIGLMMLTFAGLICLGMILNGKRVCMGLGFLFITFMGIFSWQFFLVMMVGAAGAGAGPGLTASIHATWPSSVFQQLTSVMPAVFLPYGVSNISGGYIAFQLGYLSIFLIAIIFLTNYFYRRNYWLAISFLWITLSLIFLYPLHNSWEIFYSFFPNIFILMNTLWPNMRIYPVLSGLLIITSGVSLGLIKVNSEKYYKLIKYIIILLVLWSGYQYHQITKSYDAFNDIFTEDPNYIKKSNFMEFPFGANYETLAPLGNYDPLLRFQLLDIDKKPLNDFSNWAYINNKCKTELKKKPLDFNIKKVELNGQSPTLITRINIIGEKQYILCMQFNNIQDRFFLETSRVGGETAPERLMVLPGFENNTDDKSKTVIFPLNVAKKGDFDLNVSIWSHTLQNISIQGATLFEYSHDELPIKIKTFTPLDVSFAYPKAEKIYLDPYRIFNVNYKSVANGSSVRVVLNDNIHNKLLIPIDAIAGSNQLRIWFEPTRLVRYCFYISLATIFLSVTYLIYAFRKKY